MKTLVLFILVILASNLIYSQSWDFTDTDYESTDFTSVGSSYWVDDVNLNPSKRMRLVPLYGGLYGSFWLNSKTINPSLKWTASFTADINYGSPTDADGLAFTIQPTGTAANGNIYYGAYNANALSVSIITYETNLINVYANNSTSPKGSISANLVGFTSFNVTISYAPTTTTLSVALNQAGGPNVSYDVDIDLANELGTTADFTIGFSAQTGGAANNHGIHNFTFDEQIIFANSSSSGNNDGTSWDDAFVSLQSALDVAVSGDEIWVAEGTYKPSVDDAGQINADERRHTFQMKNGVGIYGGFAGTETSVDDRQIGANETILSGERGGAGASDNCYNVFYHPSGLGLTNSAVLDGFTITKGYMGSYPYRDGAAMHNDGSSPTIRNCKVLNNRSYNGGGFFFKDASSPKIINTVFVSNIAYYGGGIYNQGTSELEVVNCTFTGNDGGAWGGAIENVATSLTAKNCIFWGNTAVGANSSEIYNSASKIALFYNCNIKGGVTNINSNATDGGGNKDSNPLFAMGSSVDYPFSLTESSPCLDVGLDVANSLNYDIRGNDFGRKLLKTDANTVGTIDMGAYEYKHGTDQTTSIIFVNYQATSGNNNGSSWADAFTSLQSGLDAAAATSEIWVAKGTYKPSSSYSLENTSRFYHFEMIEDVEIYGGFAGTESATSQRVNFGVDEVNETILSGDIGTTGTDTDNCYHVLSYIGNTLTTNAVLDGFTITKGYADGAYPHGYGGGIYNAYSYFKIRNCTFTDNYSSAGGGGLNINQCNNGGFVVENCIFLNNDALQGGGVYIYEGSNHTFTNTVFSGNSSNSYGGGLFMVYSVAASLNNCLFNGNTASSFGGGCRIDGLDQEIIDCTITNCTFTNNSTVDASGGGAVFINSNSKVTITNSIVWGNTSNATVNEIETDMGGSRTVSYSDIRGGLIGTGNINADPKFAGSSLSLSYPYSIMGTSPCADVGYNDANAELYDIRGNDYGRKLDKTDGDPGTIDMGAYEYKFGTDPAYTPVIYVNHLAVGNDDGTTWTDAYPSFQSALDEAVSGQQIWVAKGTYKPSQELDGTTDTPREFTFQMVEGVEIYGGFTGTGTETATSQRTDYGLSGDNETVLSGDIGTSGVDTDNCYNVFYNGYSTGLTSAAVLDGFTVTKGYADGANNYRGGGMYNEYKCPLVRNCNFTYNIALYGGALYMFNIYEETELLLNCNFINNGSLTAGACNIGGALSINSSSNFTIDGCTFANNNAADDAGSLTLSGATIKMTNCIFSSNSSTNGGALNIKYSSASVFTNCLFENNTSTAFGGAISIEGNSGTTPEPVFNNCTFANNTAGGSKGGALLLDRYSTYTMNNCIAWGNTANGAENEITLDAGATGTVSYSDIRGSKPEDVWDTDLGTDGGNNIDANPMFQLTGDYPYAISGVSPCVNTGNNSIPQEANDIRGNGFNRVVNSIIDMGAYEYNGTTDPVNPTLTWTGASTTDWNTSGNWDGGMVPIAGYNVTIPNLANNPIIGATNNADCNDLTVDGSAILTIESTIDGTGSLIVGGDLANSGTINSQRYFPGASLLNWHMVSAPSSMGIAASGFAPGDNDDFYAWDEPTPGTWVNYKNTTVAPTFSAVNGGDNFVASKGYLVAYNEANPTKTFSGNLYVGNQTFTLKNSGGKSWTYVNGWNLMGNPYSSAIDWNLVINRSLFVDDFAYAYNPQKNGVGGFEEIDGSLANAYIAANQGFFVIANPATANNTVFTFTNNLQTHGGAYYKNKSVEEKLVLRFFGELFYDETTIRQRDESTYNKDRIDAFKMNSYNTEAPNVYSVSDDNVNLSINSIPYIDSEHNIRIGIVAPNNGLYTMKVIEASNYMMDNNIYLEDLLLNKWHKISESDYSFTTEAGDLKDRFIIHFGVVGMDEPITPNNSIQLWSSNSKINIYNPQSISGKIKVYNMYGQVVEQSTLNRNTNQQIVLNVPMGYYIVNIVTSKEIINKKVYLK